MLDPSESFRQTRPGAVSRNRHAGGVAAGLILLGALAAPAPAGAQDLVPNGHLDDTDGVAPWAAYDGVSGTDFGFDAAVDATGAPTSGSLRMSNESDVAGAFVSFHTCIPSLPAGERYFRSRVRFASGQTKTGQLDLQMSHHLGVDCTGDDGAGTVLAHVYTSQGPSAAATPATWSMGRAPGT